MTLYEIATQYAQIREMAEDPAIDRDAVIDTLESVEGDLKDKADAYAILIREAKARIEARNAEIERLSKDNAPDTTLIEKLTRSLSGTFKALEIPKLKTTLFSFAFRKNPGRTVWDDETKIPERFWKPQPPKIDTAGIRAFLKDCEKEGKTCDWARLETSERFEIK